MSFWVEDGCEDWDVERVGLRKDARPCVRFRDAVPLNKDLDAAVVACGKAWKHPSVVVFLSVDGCNTAGLCAVATLIDLCGVAPLDAWNGIRAARPIFSEGHVALLNARYPGHDFRCDAAPAWYGPQVEGDAEDDEPTCFVGDEDEALGPRRWVCDDEAEAMAAALVGEEEDGAADDDSGDDSDVKPEAAGSGAAAGGRGDDDENDEAGGGGGGEQ